jgi:2-polyprenyl-3-methyl-5-hydroxy-6-metoxy-1,4-benzoquinol methylase
MSIRPFQFPSWNELYEARSVETMPWFYPDLDPDLAKALDRRGIASGRALDLGTGPGTQAIALAKRGLDVTATDLSAAAIAYAVRRASGEDARVRFLQDDILASRLEGAFDVIFDRGCFHVLDPDKRSDYARRLHALVSPNGRVFLKTFSAKQPGTQGPYRFTEADLRAVFEPLFTIAEVTETLYQGTLDPMPFALFCVLEPVRDRGTQA